MISADDIAEVKNELQDLKSQLASVTIVEERIVIRQQIAAKEAQLTELYKLISSMNTGFSPTANLNIEVNEIPDELLADTDDESNHASSMFLKQYSSSVKQWFKRVLVNPQEWSIPHPMNQNGPSNNFRDYLTTFDSKYKVWCIENDNEANIRLNLFVRNGKSIIICGRSDFLITPTFTPSGLKVSKVNRLSHIHCVIEIQSHPDTAACEHQMFAYLYLLMNAKGMHSLIGFLVYSDGDVRAYRATRTAPTLGGVSGRVYEENDRFHVSNIAQVFSQLMS